MLIDPDRACELCSGPLLIGSKTGICRSNKRCMQESDNRSIAATVNCKICGTQLASTRNKIGICRTNDKCRREAKRIHDRTYHQSLAKPKNAAPAKKEEEIGLLPDDELTAEGYIDEVAVRIMVNGVRHVALTQIERVEVVRQMLVRGAGVRDMCDHLHVHPSTVREILDELGYECVRNAHIAGSKIMVILPKNRVRKTGQEALTQVS